MTKIAFVFPGQGSQYVGMGKSFLDVFPEASTIFETASEVTGLPIKQLCIEGPMEDLTKTSHLQPCLTAVEMIFCKAATDAGLQPVATAGHSLGEYPALWAAGAIGLEDTLRLVHERGKLMERAATEHPGAMAAVLGVGRDDLEEMLEPFTKKGAISLANHNSPEQIVVTGEKKLVSAFCKVIKEKGAKAIPLKVTGAFHSPLMKEPAEAFSSILKDVTFTTPQVAVYTNVSAEPENDPDKLKELLAKQMCAPVRWYEIVTNMVRDGVTTFIELGPNKVLSNLIKKSVTDKGVEVYQIEDREGLEKCLSSLSRAQIVFFKRRKVICL